MKKQWAELYRVAAPRSKITSPHLFRIPFSECAYNYGYKNTPNEDIYHKELSSVSEAKAWGMIFFSTTEAISEPDSRTQFRWRKYRAACKIKS